MENNKKTTDFKPNWFYFLSLCIFSLLCFYSEVWGVWGGILVGLFALAYLPNKKFHAWGVKQLAKVGDIVALILGLGMVLLLIGGFIWFVLAIFKGVGNMGKYEGMTAEEWFNEYDYCEGQLEDYQQCVEGSIPNIVYYCSP